MGTRVEIGMSLLLVVILWTSSCSDKEEMVVIEDSYWQIENPSLHNFDTELLNEGIDKASKTNNLYALLVARNNRLVVEEYYNGKTVNDLLHLRSITKNLIIIALHEFFVSPNQDMEQFDNFLSNIFVPIYQSAN